MTDPHTPAPRVLLGNFDVERRWAEGVLALPEIARASANAVTNHLGELALLLGRPGDAVVLKAAPDPDFLDRLRSVGFATADVIVAESTAPARTVTQDLLDSPAALERLRVLAAEGAILAPHGYSEDEERLSRETGLAAPLPSAALAARVNSKIYSRRLCADLDIRRAPGWECETLAEFEALEAPVKAALERGTTVGVKSALGVSGRGITTLTKPSQWDGLVRLLRSQARKAGTDALALVVEEWQAKAADVNYHFTIDAEGRSRFDFAVEAVTENGRHIGHRIPADLAPGHLDELRSCAALIGARLAAEGYRGPVGVDALVCQDGTLMPVLEINARNNMSTYHLDVVRRAPGRAAVVQFDLRLHAALPFPALAAALAGTDMDAALEHGFLVTGFAPVNANAGTKDPFPGRLHGILCAPSQSDLAALHDDVASRLTRLEEHHVR